MTKDCVIYSLHQELLRGLHVAHEEDDVRQVVGCPPGPVWCLQFRRVIRKMFREVSRSSQILFKTYNVFLAVWPFNSFVLVTLPSDCDCSLFHLFVCSIEEGPWFYKFSYKNSTSVPVFHSSDFKNNFQEKPKIWPYRLQIFVKTQR